MSTPLPQQFADMLATLGHEAYTRLPEVIASTGPAVSIRINRAKGGAAPAGATVVPWCANGYYMDSRPQFTLDPALHQGLYYVQDASSMAVATAVAAVVDDAASAERPLRYLDACAAPGGKTTAAMALLPDDALVVANEFDPRRASILTENIAKWGRPAIVTRGDASAIRGLDGFFDIIAADVPCSGEGMMRKDEQAVAQWTPALTARCAALQRDITDALWRALRPGGFLVYSTCTFNLDENERVVQRLVDEYGAEPVAVTALQRADILGAMGGYSFPAYRFVPGLVRGEGQFVAVLLKPAGDEATTARRRKDKDKSRSKASKTAFDSATVLHGQWSVTDRDGRLFAMPAALAADTAVISSAMHVVAPGIEIGELKGRDFIPAQPLAMATTLRRGAFPEAEVDHVTALAYLRREAVSAPEGTPRGIVLLTHNGRPLGFIKNIGNRANNLYPAPWRIIKDAPKG